MIAALRNWILGMAGTALFCSVCLALTPSGNSRSVQKTICGLLMSLSLISPLIRLDYGAYALHLAEYRNQAEEISRSAENVSDNSSREYIAGACEAYILDKARSCGAELSGVRVEVLQEENGQWYPVSAEMEGDYNAALADRIAGDLGIKPESQHWRGEHG